MARAELYLLLPKYIDSKEDNSTYLESYELMENNESHIFIESIEKLNVFLSHENFQGYYDSNNVKAFVYPLQQMDDCYPNQRNYLRSILKNWENWRDVSLQNNMDSFLFNSMDLSDDTLCEIAKRGSVDDGNTYLLLNHQALKFSVSVITITCNGTPVEIDQCNTDINSVSTWFETNRRPPRSYNHNPKHGENGRGAFMGASPNLCSRSRAAFLLQKAIGLHNSNDLYFYDEENSKYIVFKNENTPSNTFHSFHVDVNEVPKAILTKISEVIPH